MSENLEKTTLTGNTEIQSLLEIPISSSQTEDTKDDPVAVDVVKTATIAKETSDVIPQTVYDNLPKLLKESCSIFTDVYERDDYLTGALSVLGGCYHNLFGFNEVDKKSVATNLISFIVAPSASGKSSLNYARKIAHDIRDTFADHTKQIGSKAGGKLFIPANNSSSGLIQLLQQNNGVGVIIESDIDTLVNATKQEWGNYTEILRNSFENETASLYRKTDKEYAEIDNLKLSLAISGTVQQFKTLMVSAENGLFSRGCYYIFENTSKTLKSYGRVNSKTDIDSEFASFAKIANEYYEHHLTFERVRVMFSEKQLSEIQEILQHEYNDLLDIKELRANIIRSFVIAIKIATQLTFLFNSESKTVAEEMPCLEQALKASVELTLTYLRHSYKAYELLPKKAYTTLSVNEQRVFSMLPAEFTRKDVVDKAQQIGQHTKTADNYIKKYKEKKVVETAGYGKFKKTI